VRSGEWQTQQPPHVFGTSLVERLMNIRRCRAVLYPAGLLGARACCSKHLLAQSPHPWRPTPTHQGMRETSTGLTPIKLATGRSTRPGAHG